MSIIAIEPEQLREMVDREGLIIQGCGGPLSEWVDGINDMLTEDGILKNGSRFQKVLSFEHDKVTCLLFLFEDVELDAGKLAVWRLKTHGEFYGTWLSDYVSNRLGGFINESQYAIDKPDCPLIGQDGNVFNLVGIASHTLKRCGLADQAKEMTSRVMSSGSYSEALSIIGEYVSITDEEHVREYRPSVVKQIRDTDEVYGVWAVHGAGSVFGHAEAWCKDHGKVIEFDSAEEAKKYAAQLNAEATSNCHYLVKQKHHERDAVKYPLQRTPDDKVPAPGRPVHLPENYLLNAELKEEAQTGNYNMLDGRMDNIAPESAAEKASVVEKLKADQSDREQKPPSHGSKSQERSL